MAGNREKDVTHEQGTSLINFLNRAIENSQNTGEEESSILFAALRSNNVQGRTETILNQVLGRFLSALNLLPTHQILVGSTATELAPLSVLVAGLETSTHWNNTLIQNREIRAERARLYNRFYEITSSGNSMRIISAVGIEINTLSESTPWLPRTNELDLPELQSDRRSILSRIYHNDRFHCQSACLNREFCFGVTEESRLDCDFRSLNSNGDPTYFLLHGARFVIETIDLMNFHTAETVFYTNYSAIAKIIAQRKAESQSTRYDELPSSLINKINSCIHSRCYLGDREFEQWMNERLAEARTQDQQSLRHSLLVENLDNVQFQFYVQQGNVRIELAHLPWSRFADQRPQMRPTDFQVPIIDVASGHTTVPPLTATQIAQLPAECR